MEFDQWFYKEKRINKLSALGDFAAKFIIANPEQTLRDLPWDEAGKLILREFYGAVRKEPP